MRIKNLTIMIGLVLTQGCAMKSSAIAPTQLPLNRTTICQNEIEGVVGRLIGAREVKLSTDVFTKEAYLYLTNQKGTLLHPSPIYNYPNGRKKLMLFKRDDILYIGLLDKEDKLIKENKLLHCP